MSYGWMITKNLVEKKDDPVFGGANISKEHEQMLRAGKGETFIMKDDDNETYYKGRIVGDYNGFEPLDDYGMPNAGCTSIWYKNKETDKFEMI